jgi:hypothetical protein
LGSCFPTHSTKNVEWMGHPALDAFEAKHDEATWLKAKNSF